MLGRLLCLHCAWMPSQSMPWILLPGWTSSRRRLFWCVSQQIWTQIWLSCLWEMQGMCGAQIPRTALISGTTSQPLMVTFFNQRPSHVDSNMFVHFLVCLLTSPRVLHTFSSTISMGKKEKTEVGTEVVEGVKKNPTQAKCTVLAIQFFLQNCAQPHEDRTCVLPHMTLYLSTRHARSYHSQPEICYFQEFCLWRPNICFQKLTKIVQKKIAGLHPALLPYEAVPHPPTQVGGDCLAAVVLDNQDRALRLYMRGRWYITNFWCRVYIECTSESLLTTILRIWTKQL